MNLISQSYFKDLQSLVKVFDDKKSVSLEGSDQLVKWTKEITSKDNKESFLFDYRRTSLEINKSKATFNTRYRKVIIMLRLDMSGIHTNPEEFGGDTFEGPHIHIYNEKHHDKVAYSLDKIKVTQKEIEDFDLYQILKKLLDFFNTEYPTFDSKIEF